MLSFHLAAPRIFRDVLYFAKEERAESALCPVSCTAAAVYRGRSLPGGRRDDEHTHMVAFSDSAPGFSIKEFRGGLPGPKKAG